ncbi:BREX system serine/threonine kinase PglW [Nocardia ignorata]|uniref:Serine/threonine protein kinase n=1 Tax=Nocardia ignorata TaxID=145285 RepID=A0A4R6P0U3_NOCIG|nr:BREX system serine/threonine kinase PglW [Nocardia ignorata]TDP30805.1 serine/threonine protein kinase [Nocardia ignorata]
MDEGRWTTVTESSFEHERRGLEAIRTQLPNVDPWFAWSNFTFTADTGHVREVDLLVIAPNGVLMVELKDWRGRLTSEGSDWIRTNDRGDRRVIRSPLHLVTQKSRELAGLLNHQKVNVFVGAAVCLTHPDMRFDLLPGDRANTHTVAELIARLNAAPRDIKHLIDFQRAKAIKKGLEKVGIRRSNAEFVVGPYELERKPLDAGPTWQDYLARHTELREPVRVRIYLRARGADEQARKSVDATARREASVLRRFRHPGVVQLEHFDPSAHSAGPALIFRYHPETLHLDEYLANHGAVLSLGDRVKLVRQLAETLRSAHSARLYHRGLAARSVHVVPRRGANDAERWREPLLQISDWQVATQRSAGTALSMTRHAPTLLSAHHLSSGSDAYLAPEVSAPAPDPIAMDVYGLGMLTYLLVTGKAPTSTQAELLARFEAGEELRPSAVVDDLPEDLDLLVAASAEYRPTRRFSSIAEFIEILESVEHQLTTPLEEEPKTPDLDPLEAGPDDMLADRWLVRRRLGTGSTSRALLVRDLEADADKRKNHVVLKVALSDDRDEVLTREASVLRGLRRHSGIIDLVDPGVTTLAGRTTLVLEYVGDELSLEGDSKTRRRTEETVARELRDNGRLQVGRLETYSDYLFAALDFLEGEGVWHRDLKPDNIAIRVRPNRTRELVLIDFSLAGYPVQNTDAGTEGYLDPFIGTLLRGVYDAHAERYALAVTLHEMASGELPRWGDGSVLPRQLDPVEFPYPEVAADAFDPSVRDGLVEFFRKALHRDTAQRFSDLKPMRDAWRKIFLDMTRSVPSRPLSSHPAPVVDTNEESPEDQRRQIAEQATLDTHLSQAGVTAATEQFLYGLGVNTVGEFLDYGRGKLINAPGLGARSRREIQDRLKQWGRRLGKEEPTPLASEVRKEAKAEITAAGTDLSSGLLSTLSLDALAAGFVPERRAANANKVDAITRLLRIPGAGDLPELDAWPTQAAVAETLNLTSGRVAQLLKSQRTQWKKDPAVQALREQVLELLESLGRVASATELADALIARRGTRLHERSQRRALGLAAVRVVVEVEQLAPEEAAIYVAQKRDSGANPVVVLALEADEDNAFDAPAAPALAQYALKLGKTADALADQETLPTATTVLDRLGAIEPPAGTFALDERRLVQVAVGASRNAAVTPRLEIYPRDLPLVRAVRLTQAGLVTLTPGMPLQDQPGLRAQTVFERILARFPELSIAGSNVDLPTADLTKALRDAGFGLVVATHPTSRTQRYLPEIAEQNSSYTAHTPRWTTAVSSHAAGRYSDDPNLAKAARAEELLVGASVRDGFRVLTATIMRNDDEDCPNAAAELRDRFSARPMSVTALFLATMHELLPKGKNPTWDTILRADVAPPGSKAAMKFSEYAISAWNRIGPEIEANIAGNGPLLLTDTLVFARYNAMGLLGRLAEQARRGKGGLWLLCPQADPMRPPHLGAVAVPYQSALNEWIQLPASWINNHHRAKPQTDSGVSA